MKKRKRKINWFKLVSFIIGTITLIYLAICIISYTTKTTKSILEYEPKETIIVK